MASAFIGFHVSLILNSGIKLDGIVAHIDPFTQQMTLHDGKKCNTCLSEDRS